MSERSTLAQIACAKMTTECISICSGARRPLPLLIPMRVGRLLFPWVGKRGDGIPRDPDTAARKAGGIIHGEVAPICHRCGGAVSSWEHEAWCCPALSCYRAGMTRPSSAFERRTGWPPRLPKNYRDQWRHNLVCLAKIRRHVLRERWDTASPTASPAPVQGATISASTSPGAR